MIHIQSSTRSCGREIVGKDTPPPMPQATNGKAESAAKRNRLLDLGSQIPDETVVVAVKGQVSCDLAEEAVVLSLEEGIYYGLNAVGAGIWKLLQQPRTVNDIRASLLEEYDVEPERCDRELKALLHHLAQRNLLEIADATTA